jgi:hypothetical protein
MQHTKCTTHRCSSKKADLYVEGMLVCTLIAKVAKECQCQRTWHDGASALGAFEQNIP